MFPDNFCKIPQERQGTKSNDHILFSCQLIGLCYCGFDVVKGPYIRMKFPHRICQLLRGQSPGVIRCRNRQDGICVFFCFPDDLAVILVTEHSHDVDDPFPLKYRPMDAASMSAAAGL